MKKRVLYLSLVTLLMAVFCMTLLSGCVNIDKFAPNGENLAAGAVFTNKDGKTSKKFKMTDKNPEMKVTFPEEKEINTLLFNENSFAVTALEIWTPVDGKLKLIYKQDEINGLRYCYLNNIRVRELTIRAYSNRVKFTINRFEAYNIVREKKDFRITTYLTVGSFLEYPTSTEGLKHVTDIILFGVTKYDEMGNIFVEDENMEKAIAIIKNACGENMPRIFSAFVLESKMKNESNMSGDKFFASLQKIALQTNSATLIENLANFVRSKNLDGIAFDYEYPYTQNDYDVYGKFLVRLKAAIPEKLISIAVAPWGLKFSAKAINAVDIFEIMAYDLMNERGNHSSWRTACTDAIEYMVNQHIPKEKLNLGVPFYSRPVDGAAYWGGYSGEYEKLGEFSNCATDESISHNEDGSPFLLKTRWYNGVNMIQDKTAFAFDYGVGGMMIWHYACDVDYNHDRSLLRAMNNIFDI